ncbi:cytochrome P450 72A15 [Selaginella moellendorffii]|uniref:cytochrome P450 72A15 n=1 Tax=Selaginella moellendorffii TaxID=88036 RepID=UPI000D1C45CC|nr:cytochrome P450 72A15 [Selaginella moellendorffii]|eukprot:XP_024517890.1 cytochrome P450 72A15 [Selaginella moellendorffii]
MAVWLWTIAALCIALVWKGAAKLLLKPWILEAKLRQQGIRGPPRSILSGNVYEIFQMRARTEAECIQGPITHDIVEYVEPHLLHWAKLYGLPLLWWWGTEPGVVLTDLDMIKEVLYNKSGAFWSPEWQRKFQVDILGRGLAVVNGDEWAFRRRILAPAFHAEKIKFMVGGMRDCVAEMLEKWNALTVGKDEPIELEVCKELTTLTSDIISRAAFGSSYKKGHKVFELLDQVGGLVYKKFSSPWIQSMLPICKVNREIKTANSKLRSTLEEIVQARRDQKLAGEIDNYGSDLLGIMLDEVDAGHHDDKTGLSFTTDSLMEECKTFYIAGQETSAKWLAWTMMLLAANPSWQEQAREEVRQVCQSQAPDAESLSKLKIVGMVLNESLRLYPPAVFNVRTCYKDAKLRHLSFPEGSGVIIPILYLLHDKDIWGDDANEFNPQRFADGISSASKSHHSCAFLPFSQGQRVCLGQSFAQIEAKVAMAMILQRFSFRLSPTYRHSPVHRLALQPQHGVPLLLGRP